jgi:hypothetical protein
VVEAQAGRGAGDGYHERRDVDVDLLGHAAVGAGEGAGQRTEAFADAGPVEAQATQHLDEVARPREAAAEADRAQAPATAEPEPALRAVLLECGRAQQRLRRLQRHQALEDLGRLVLAGLAIDRAVGDVLRQAGGEVHGREFVGQERAIRLGERIDQRGEVAPFGVGEPSGRDGRAQRLAHAEPIPVEVIGRQAEVARASAQQPAEDDAAADVQQAPAPVLGRPEQLARLRGQQRDGHLLVDEGREQALGGGDLRVAVGLRGIRLLGERVEIRRAFQVFLEDGAVRLHEGLEHQAEIGIGGFGRAGVDATVVEMSGGHGVPFEGRDGRGNGPRRNAPVVGPGRWA